MEYTLTQNQLIISGLITTILSMGFGAFLMFIYFGLKLYPATNNKKQKGLKNG